MRKVRSNPQEIVKTEILRLQGKYIAFLVTGTWLVNIDGMLLEPGQYWQENVEGMDCLDNFYNIQFIEDLAADYVGVKTLKQGKFILVRTSNYVSNG
jgi:hypothetical protein